eukprot:GHVR01034916.1.p1 GENE.GHVR01034916.1~~GHVR01034916.1.p1  ORF type:complete len:330 (-),score=20.31 GHVR01034916.1:270-1259(-)
MLLRNRKIPEGEAPKEVEPVRTKDYTCCLEAPKEFEPVRTKDYTCCLEVPNDAEYVIDPVIATNHETVIQQLIESHKRQAAVISHLSKQIAIGHTSQLMSDANESRRAFMVNLKDNPVTVVAQLVSGGKAEAQAHHAQVISDSLRGLGKGLHRALDPRSAQCISVTGVVDDVQVEKQIADDSFRSESSINKAILAQVLYATSTLADLMGSWSRAYSRTNINQNYVNIMNEGIFFGQMSDEEYRAKIVNNKDKVSPWTASKQEGFGNGNKGNNNNNRGNNRGNRGGGRGNRGGGSYDQALTIRLLRSGSYDQALTIRLLRSGIYTHRRLG